MGNNFPVMPELQLCAVEYAVSFVSLNGQFNSIPAGSLGLVNFGFQRGTDADGTILFDYSAFDQDTYEASLRGLLNQLSAVMAGNVGLPVANVRAGITVTRNWFFYTAGQLDGAYMACPMTDQMLYP